MKTKGGRTNCHRGRIVRAPKDAPARRPIRQPRAWRSCPSDSACHEHHGARVSAHGIDGSALVASRAASRSSNREAELPRSLRCMVAHGPMADLPGPTVAAKTVSPAFSQVNDPGPSPPTTCRGAYLNEPTRMNVRGGDGGPSGRPGVRRAITSTLREPPVGRTAAVHGSMLARVPTQLNRDLVVLDEALESSVRLEQQRGEFDLASSTSARRRLPREIGWPHVRWRRPPVGLCVWDRAKFREGMRACGVLGRNGRRILKGRG